MAHLDTTVVYYNKRQVLELGSNFTVKLYSDRDRKNVVGQAIFNPLSYNNLLTEESWTQELATFYLGDKDTITFDSSSKTAGGVLPAGEYDYSIICGQGKYLGATGVLHYKVTEGGLRIVTITAKLA